MLPEEIIKSGVALSGDALHEFMNHAAGVISEADAEIARKAAIDAIDEAVTALESIRDDL